MSAFKDWYSRHEDDVLAAWDEHLSYKQDSIFEIMDLANDEGAYWEFAEEMYVNSMVALGESLEDR